MALVLNDRVKETSTTTGTGTFSLGGAVDGFESFVTGIADGNTTYYAAVNRDANEFEVGIGTVTDASPDTLARTTIISSSNSDSAVNFSAGTKDIFVTLPASKVAFEDASNDVTIGNDLILGSDSAVLKFGADSDTTLTHSDGTGLTLNSTNKLLFRDTGLYINSSTDGQLDLVADTEIQIAATTIDINGNVEISGDLTVSGDDITMGTNTSGNILVADGTNFNSIAATDLSAISTIASGDTLLAVDASGGGLKKVARSVLVAGLATSSALNNVSEDDTPQLGGNLDMNGSDIVTTSNADLELAPNGTGHVTVKGNTNSGAIQFNCESNSHGQIVIAQPHSAAVTNTLTLPAGSSSTLVSLVSTDTLTNKTLTSPVINTGTFGTSILPTSADGTTLGSASKEFSDLFLADGGVIYFGNDQEITLTHVADDGLVIKHVGTGDGKEPSLTFQAGDTDIAVDDVLGSIFFQAPNEGAGTDAILVAAGIEAVSEGDFSSSNNATKLSFKTAASEAASEKMSLSSAGNLSIAGNLIMGSATVTEAQAEILDGATVTTTELNLIDGGTARGTTAVATGDGILINDGGTMRMTNVDTVSTYFSSHNVGGGNIVTTGALDSGSITSGFGTIDTGSSTITTTGLISGGSLDIDNVLINGTTIGHTDDTDLITVADGLVTVAGEVQMTTLDIGGTNVSATAAEINYSDLATLGTSAASKVLSADANNLTKITGGVFLEEDTLSFDATQDWDVRASPVAQVTLTANVTFDAPSNPTTGQYISIVCIQDGTGSRTIAWNAVFEFTGGTAPTATTTAGKADLFTFRYHNSHWIEVGRNLNLTRA